MTQLRYACRLEPTRKSPLQPDALDATVACLEFLPRRCDDALGVKDRRLSAKRGDKRVISRLQDHGEE